MGAVPQQSVKRNTFSIVSILKASSLTAFVLRKRPHHVEYGGRCDRPRQVASGAVNTWVGDRLGTPRDVFTTVTPESPAATALVSRNSPGYRRDSGPPSLETDGTATLPAHSAKLLVIDLPTMILQRE
ncbi:hypothetical protein EVAR_67152_1 [Eumeta japonica]|uniref:Uncharacterized protein n=1 Tax=Eumeta variegata TaxID=151549 RepID=A0A4C1ZWJ2_EUMVA|nr:hypothetical protein EVAR_67152_1 [Eumeta japonica]